MGGGSKYHGGSIYHTGGGGQFSIRGFNIPWMKIDTGVNLPWGSKYHMTQCLFPTPNRPLGNVGSGTGNKHIFKCGLMLFIIEEGSSFCRGSTFVLD